MEMKALICLIFAGLILVGGCSAEVEQVAVHTVPEFKASSEMLREVLTRCNANPGELGSTPNCINVTKAAQELILEHRQQQAMKSITWGDKGSK